MKRLFIAIDPPHKIKNIISKINITLPGAKRVKIDQLHITLRFLGNIDLETTAIFSNALQNIRQESFSLPTKPGYAASKKGAQTLWIAIKRSNSLIKPKESIDQIAEDTGLRGDKTFFRPHISIARLKNVSFNDINSFIAKTPYCKLPDFSANNFHLYSSTLQPSGAIQKRYPIRYKKTT